jgi:protein-disulfide isomerase
MAENKMSVDKTSFIFGLVLGVAIISVGALLMVNFNKKDGGEVKGEKVAGEEQQPAAEGTKPAAEQPQAQAVPAISDNDYVKGNQDASVALIEYSDFECPYCLRHNATMEQIYNEYKDKIKVVFRHFPLSFHENAQKAAEASECAGEQGKFWEMHDKIFAANEAGTMSVEQWKKYAAELKLNTTQFNSCLDDGKYVNEILREQAAGQAAGVEGTPATFINGQLVSGAVPYEQFKAAIDQALAK